MRVLEIYPNSRSLRVAQKSYLKENRLLPTLTTIGEFEKSIIMLDRRVVDRIKRVIYLQEVSKFDNFKSLNIDVDLIKFFSRSEAIFKFFEELSHERVTFNDLTAGDSYSEFERDIEIVERLFNSYREYLHRYNLTDRAFIPDEYRLNRGYIKRFDRIELHLEGYLTRFEFELIDEVSKSVEFIIHMETSQFNIKLQDRFREFGIELPEDSTLSLNFTTREVLTSQKVSMEINAKTFGVEERVSQVILMFKSISEMVSKGVKPEDIAVVLPDENFKEILKLYDKFNNLNFAMGLTTPRREPINL